jgi:hypothetical protein
MSTTKDLTKEAPRSPRERIGGYVILARAIDKGHASIDGDVGEYHFDCPLDNMLFEFKGVKGAEVKKLIESGTPDKEIAAWLDENGTKKTPDEVKAWSDMMEAYRPYDNPEKKEWFAGECAKIGVDPTKATLFDWLDADDKASFKK